MVWRPPPRVLAAHTYTFNSMTNHLRCCSVDPCAVQLILTALCVHTIDEAFNSHDLAYYVYIRDLSLNRSFS
ncbi:MAG: hypothetical protein JWQ40_1952 [Segetibacter sp.]|nr:hypothetical protein [Segetibacter sp.]